MLASAEERVFSNSEMSAPDTNAVSPMPRSTTTRTCGSFSNASMMSGTAAHMSVEHALRRAGLLKISQPIGPSILAIIRSVFSVRVRSVMAVYPLGPGMWAMRRGSISAQTRVPMS